MLQLSLFGKHTTHNNCHRGALPPRASRKGENLKRISKQDLQEWQKNGCSYEMMADLAETSVSTVYKCLVNYGLISRKAVTEEEIKWFCQMRGAGKSTKEISRITGRSYSGVYNALKAAGMIQDRGVKEELETTGNRESQMFVPQVVKYAEKKHPKPVKFIYKGKRWIDITEYWM